MEYKLTSGETFNIKNSNGETVLKIDTSDSGSTYVYGIGGYSGATTESASTIQELINTLSFYDGNDTD